MKIVSINTVTFGSTGKLMLQNSSVARSKGHIAYVCYPIGRHNPKLLENSIAIGGRISEDFHIIMDRFTGLNGCFSYFATKRFINKLKKINPDVIHLHNIHNCYINLRLLFKYLKDNNICTVWTLHDCWSFTGHCPYFDIVECSKWQSGCYNCPQYRLYPKSFVDSSKGTYKRKKKWFTEVPNLTLVTPSNWLADLAKQSFLKEYPVKVINNGIDLNIFKPTESDFRKKHNCENKKVILGVAFGWGKRKGLDVFIRLAKQLDNSFQIVLVGTDDKIAKVLPKNIISIHRTANQTELAELYTAADMLLNPTREDNFPTVNIEALACGIPVITFETGGSPESLDDTCGSVIPKDDYDSLLKEILRIAADKPFSSEACIKRAQKYNMCDRFNEYIDLYEDLVQKKYNMHEC